MHTTGKRAARAARAMESMREEKRSTDPNDLLTVAEVADILRVDDTTVRRWIKSGAMEAVELPHVNKRRAYRVKRETLARLFDTPFPVEV